MKFYIFILSLMVFSACTSSQKENTMYYSDFPEEHHLTGTEFHVDTAMLRYPFRIQIMGERAIVMDLHGADHYFHMFHYPEFTYISSFGKRGDSPKEMLSAETFQCVNGEIWTLDANKAELTRFVECSSGDSLLREEAVTLDKQLLRSLDFVVYDDSTFIIPDYSGERRFCRVGRNGNLLSKASMIPTENESALLHSRPALAQAWRSFFDYNPHNGVMATTTQLGEVLEIFHPADSTHLVCIGPHGEPEFKVSGSYGIPTGIMGFSDVQVTDHAIYAVFHGRTFKELAQQQPGHIIDGGQFIYKFSLEGKPLCKYVLDRYVYGIHVDETKKTITATDVNTDQPIVEFRF